jgi:hypothetical protein
MTFTPNDFRFAAPENCIFSLDESIKVIVKIHPCLSIADTASRQACQRFSFFNRFNKRHVSIGAHLVDLGCAAQERFAENCGCGEGAG